jgi:hypothetical protein
MSDEDAEIREVLVAAAESIIEKRPEYGYLIVMVKPDNERGQGLNYATNFEAEGLHIIAQAFAPNAPFDDTDFPPSGNRTVQ